MKCTPGPWEVAPKDIAQMLDSVWVVRKACLPGEMIPIIANIWKINDEQTNVIRDEEAMANARLIAAALEMYDLLVCAAVELRAGITAYSGELADTIDALLKRVEG